MTRNGWSYGAGTAMGARGDALLDRLHDLELEEERRRRLLLVGVTAAVALHALLLAVAPLPEGETITIPVALDRYVLAPTPRFAPPPAAAPPEVAPPARRVPMPDPTPEAPEPLPRPAEALPTLAFAPDDSLVGIPAPPPDETPTILVVGRDVSPPARLFAPPPLYPRAALLARREATVELEAILDESGRVTSLRALTGHGFGFEEAAVAAVEQWRFRPSTRDGRPVPVLYRLSVTFTIAN